MGYAASNQAETEQLVGSTTLSLELAVEVGQLVLIAVTKFAGTTASIQSVTADANAATFVRTVENTEDDRRQLHLYSWVSDVTDTIDIEVVFDVAQPFGMAAAAYDVGDPEIITHAGTSGSSSAPAHTVSSASGRIVASFLAVRGSPSATPDGGQDSRFTYNFFPEDSNYTWLALSDEAGDTSNTLSWTLGSSSQWNIITVQLAAPEPEPEGPEITVHPQNVEVTEPDPGVFTVSATGTGTLSYQWQVNDGEGWENVSSGGTTDEYTTGATSVAMDGYEFRCAVTDDNGTTVSNAATLTVNAAEAVIGLRMQLVFGGSPVANESGIKCQVQDQFPLDDGAVLHEETVGTDGDGILTVDLSETELSAGDEVTVSLLSADGSKGRTFSAWVVEDIGDSEANSLVEPEE